MPLEIPYGVKGTNPKPVDHYYDDEGTPYADITEALAAVPLGVRYQGLTVNIGGTEYWWKTTMDADPIVKVLSAAGSGDLSHTHVQGVSSATWNVNHALGKNPSVTVVNGSEEEVVGDVDYTDANNLVITFTSAFSGKAYCN